MKIEAVKPLNNFLEYLGERFTSFIEETGNITLLFIETLKWCLRPPFRLKHVVDQMEEVGVNSLPVVLITATFTGMVLALQSYTGFQRFNAESLVGTVVALSMTRELGPVLTGLIVAGRAGSAMAAELGTMRVTEQIDALSTLAVNPIHYLIVPRLVASFIMIPTLVIISDVVGILGGYAVSVRLLGANPVIYMKRTINHLELNDIYTGLLKAAVFGAIIALIGCYKGFYTSGGAEGVGKATTGSVVISSMLILICDYILTALLF
ncbi:MAG: ABC transporter permease [Candidatus Schekmanbacteria bacterium]|nr:ABC transporter permease [Candidatus Schekmanbacteria bacterium]